MLANEIILIVKLIVRTIKIYHKKETFIFRSEVWENTNLVLAIIVMTLHFWMLNQLSLTWYEMLQKFRLYEYKVDNPNKSIKENNQFTRKRMLVKMGIYILNAGILISVICLRY